MALTSQLGSPNSQTGRLALGRPPSAGIITQRQALVAFLDALEQSRSSLPAFVDALTTSNVTLGSFTQIFLDPNLSRVLPAWLDVLDTLNAPTLAWLWAHVPLSTQGPAYLSSGVPTGVTIALSAWGRFLQSIQRTLAAWMRSRLPLSATQQAWLFGSVKITVQRPTFLRGIIQPTTQVQGYLGILSLAATTPNASYLSASVSTDTFANATFIGTNPYTVTLDQRGFSTEGYEPICRSGEMAFTTWFRINTVTGGTLTLDTIGSKVVAANPATGANMLDTVVSVYRGSILSQLTEVLSNNDGPQVSPYSALGLTMGPGEQYYIQVGTRLGQPPGESLVVNASYSGTLAASAGAGPSTPPVGTASGKYLLVSARQNAPVNWQAPGYQDISWKAPFQAAVPVVGVRLPSGSVPVWSSVTPGIGDEVFLYRKSFTISRVPTSVTLSIIADGGLLESYVNGRWVANFQGNWLGNAKVFQVNPTYLVLGTNVIALMVLDSGNPYAYVAYRLQVTY